MTALFTYLLKLSVCLSVVYLFYQFFLRRLTFYNWNRWYLLGYTLLAFIIPFIRINPVLERNQLQAYDMLAYIPVVGYTGAGSINQHSGWTYEEWVLLAIAAGIIFMLIRLLIQHLSLHKMKKRSLLLIDDTIKLYQVDRSIIPFSFGRTIFVNQHQHTQEELKEIIRHEFIHVKQRHTVDILWSEVLCILNWYNPFVWLIRFSIRQNLEFIADHKVLENGLDKKEYQYLLLKVIGISQFSIATKFNFTSLKKRIAMMNKMKSARVHLLKFLFILPLLAVLLVSFRENLSSAKFNHFPEVSNDTNRYLTDRNQATHNDIIINQQSGNLSVQDTVPEPAKAPVTIIYPRLPKGVKNISIHQDIATVKLENGTKETYNLNDPAEKAAYVKKYGDLPKPPPPPPAPASPKSPVALPAPPTPPEASDKVAPAAPVAPTTPPAPAKAPRLPNEKQWQEAASLEQVNKNGYILSVADNNGECVVIIKDRNRKIVKSLLLTEWNENEKINTQKYGAIPPPPPPRTPVAELPAPGADQGIIKAPPPGYAYLNGPKKYNPANPSNGAPRVNVLQNVPVELQPLIIIDGTQTDGAVINRMDPAEIESISVLKDANLKALYGEKGNNGVILITTKHKKGISMKGDKVIVNMNEARVTNNGEKLNIQPDAPFKGLYVVNGKEYTPEEFMALDIDPATIESVQVLKGEKARESFGDKGKEGVIVVRVK